MSEHPAPHHIETGWSPSNTGAMRATCRTCGECAEAWTPATDFLSYTIIRRTQAQAKAALAETCCRDHCERTS